jgi:hypothetical protein
MNQSSSETHAHRRRRVAIAGLVLAILLIAIWLRVPTRQKISASPRPAGAPASASVKPSAPRGPGATASPAAATNAAASAELREWLRQYQQHAALGTNDSRYAALLSQGRALAEARHDRMLQLIRENPEQALQESLRFDEYAALPPEIRARVERPFSARAQYEYLPVCQGPDGQLPPEDLDHISTLFFADGAQAQAFTFGQRLAMTSKHSLPASGVVLDGVAALHDSAIREVAESERGIVTAQFSPGQRDLSKSFVTGKNISGAGVIGLAGDKYYAFADADELARFGRKLSTLDQKPGPKSGSSVIYYAGLPAGAGGEFNFPAAESYAAAEASAWTETKKKIFLIRVDFSDLAGAPVTQAAANAELNGPSSDFIRAMSYGKTWIEAAVSANVYRVPQPATYYSGTNDPSYNNSGFASLNSDLMRDARNVFRNTKSGADAAIDIGPVDNTGDGGAGGLGDYDIVAIFFGSIGMKGGGVLYAGLAGGGNMWVQAANYTSLYTHEIGHNYGLGHASFWQTSDNSVVGAGAGIEYGDPFDVMGSGPAVQGHYHPQAKALLNWLTTNQWTDATAAGSGTYRVYRIDDANTAGARRGVRITRSGAPGSEEYYWVGFRPIYVDNQHLSRGAYVNWQRPGQSRCWLIDTTPGSPGGINDSGVDLGRTYADSAANIYITPLAAGGSGSEQYLDVRVNLGSFAGNHAPTASGISGPVTVAARAPAVYSVSASDQDGDALAYCWDARDGIVNSNSASLTHTWTLGGTYSLAVSVTDMKGGTVTVSNSVTVTDPLNTWTAGTIGSTPNLQDLIFAKGRFVAVDWFGGAYLSWDGATWENNGVLPGYDNQLSSHPKLAFGANVFVVAGRKVSTSTAQICYSTDGRAWKAATFPDGLPQLYDVAYGNGQFVAVGAGGAVLTSADGITWSATTAGGGLDFNFVTWDGAAWVAVGLNSAGGYAERVWTSLDGATWNQQALLKMQALELSSYGGTTYALGYYGGLSYSVDHGVTWQKAQLPGSTAWTVRHMAAAPDGTLLVSAQAMDESGSPSALLASMDGHTWARGASNSDVAANSHALAFGHGRFLSVESNGGIRRSDPYYPANTAPNPSFVIAPSNGPARTPIYFSATASDADGDALVYAWDFGAAAPVLDGTEIAPVFSLGGSYNLTLRVSDGRGGIATLTQTIMVDDPARTWAQRGSTTTNALRAISCSSSNVVAVGDKGIIFSSADGATWTSRSVPDYDGNIYFYDIAWDGNRYLAAGKDYDFGVPGWVGVIYASTNGINWTRVYKNATASTPLNGIALNGTVRVVVGQSGAVAFSLNGTSWAPVSIPGLGATTMSGAAFGGGTFVFVGYTGGNGGAKSYTSTDGTNWVDRSAGLALANWQDLRKVKWMNDRFVASGWYSKLCVSTDGGQTFSSSRAHTEDLPAMAYGDGIWFTAGIDRDASGANIDVMSLDGVNWLSFPGPVNTNRNGAVFYNHSIIAVGAGGNIWQSGTLIPAAGFPAWQAANFPSGGAASLAKSDPDNDGVANAVEYALGRNPNLATGNDGAAQLPAAAIITNRVWLRLNLPEPAPFDIVYSIRGAADATGPWSTLATKTGTNTWQWVGGGVSRLSIGSVSGGRIPVDVSYPDSASGSAPYFLRLQIQTP